MRLDCKKELIFLKLTKSIKQVPWFQNKPWTQTSLSLSGVSFYRNLGGTASSCCYKCLTNPNDDDYDERCQKQSSGGVLWKNCS